MRRKKAPLSRYHAATIVLLLTVSAHFIEGVRAEDRAANAQLRSEAGFDTQVQKESLRTQDFGLERRRAPLSGLLGFLDPHYEGRLLGQIGREDSDRIARTLIVNQAGRQADRLLQSSEVRSLYLSVRTALKRSQRLVEVNHAPKYSRASTKAAAPLSLGIDVTRDAGPVARFGSNTALHYDMRDQQLILRYEVDF